MKKLIFIIAILLSTSLAFGATYHITQTGAGGQTGADEANADTIAEFNLDNINNGATGMDAGDTIYFYDTITTGIRPPVSGTSGGGDITLDGYAGGDCDALADSYTCTSAILAPAGNQSALLLLDSVDYITVQDFRATGGGTSTLIGANDSEKTDISDYITFQRNYFYDAGKNLFSFGRNSGYDGSNYITVEENKMAGYGKTTDSANGIRFYFVEDLIVKNNIFAGGGASNCASDNVIEVYSTDGAIFENNIIYGAYKQAGIAIKEPGWAPNENLIVRFNKIHDNGDKDDEARGIYVGNYATSIYIYGNFIFNDTSAGDGSDYGIDPNRGANYIYIWSNIIVGFDRMAIWIWTNQKDGDPRNVHHIYMYNNTIAYNSTDIVDDDAFTWTGMSFSNNSGSNYFFKNNLMYNNRPNASTYHQWATISTALNGDIDTDYNTFYHGSGTANWWYDNGARALATMQAEPYVLETNSNIADPSFNDPDGTDNVVGTEDDDYTLDGTYVDNGADLSQCFGVTIQGVYYQPCIDDALDPDNTDWTTTPPTVATVKRDVYSWDRGAYADLGAVTPPQFSTAVIASNGETITVTFDTGAYDGASYADAHWDVDCDTAGDGVTLSYVSGKDSSTWVFTLGTTILSGETCNLDFDGTANSVENSEGDDMAALTSESITNNSTVSAGGGGTTATIGSGSAGGSVGGSQTITINP